MTGIEYICTKSTRETGTVSFADKAFLSKAPQEVIGEKKKRNISLRFV